MRNKLNAAPFAAVVVTLLALGAPAQSWAQSGQASFEDQTLQAYAVAAVEVRDLQQEWIPRIQNAATSEEKQQLRDEATGQMVQAIQDEGLTVEEYNAITDAARQDPQLLRRIQGYMDR